MGIEVAVEVVSCLGLDFFISVRGQPHWAQSFSELYMVSLYKGSIVCSEQLACASQSTG
jgi:hypothetical protein